MQFDLESIKNKLKSHPYIIIIILIILVLIASSVYLSSIIVSGFTTIPIEDKLVDKTPGLVNITYEEINLMTKDNIEISTWFINNNADRTIVLLHPYRHSKSVFVEALPKIKQENFNIILFDFRGHGESSSQTTGISLLEIEDLNTVLNYYTENYPDHTENLALVGVSMGGATSLLASSALGNIDVIVSDSAFASLNSVLEYNFHKLDLPGFPFYNLIRFIAEFQFGKDLETYSPIESVKNSKVPIMIIHSKADDLVSVEDARNLYDAIPTKKEIWIVDKANHARVYDFNKEEYFNKVLPFIEANLN